MLIDITSFMSGPRQIQNASDTETPNANNLAVSKAVKGFIEYYEPIYLSEMLGSTLAQQVEAYAGIEHTEETTDSKMESLIALLKEPIADYVFFHMMRDMATQPTISGLVELKSDNKQASSLSRCTRIWNDMVRINRQLQGQISALGYDVNVDRNMLTSINTLNL